MYDPYYNTYIERTYTIVISAPVFTVTFRSNYGVETTSTQAANTTTNLTANTFSRTGYTFSGWNTLANPAGGGISYADGDPYAFTSDITLFAQWSVNQYVVTFNANTGTYAANTDPKTASLNYNSDALTQVPESPTKTGHTFLGWNTSSTATTALSTYLVPANAATLYAVWSKNSYVITFDAATNGGVFATSPTDTRTVSVEFELNALNSAPTNPSKVGQSFLGWNTNAAATTALTSYTVGTSPVTLYAIYVSGPVYFTVSFSGNTPTSGSPSSSSETQTSTGGSINLATVGSLEKTHYTFGGWSLTGTGPALSGATYTPSSNVTLLAIWVPANYTLTYIAGTGGTITGTATQTITYGSDGTAVTGAPNTGYQFVNWSGGFTSNPRTDTNISANATYTANFQLISYSITFNFNYSGAPSNEIKTLNHFVDALSNANKPTSPSRSGYAFSGWSETTTGSVISTFTVVGTKTFYSIWVQDSAPTPAPVADPQPAPAPAAKIKPAVVWKNPSAIKTTTTLSSTQLNAVATTTTSVTTAILNPATADKLPSNAPTIAGRFVYVPVVPTVVTAGTTQVTTITTAQNALTGTTKTIQTTTTPSVPTNTPSTTNVEEKPVLGQATTLAPGLQKMRVIFIPTDSTTYEPVETEVEILVQAETKVEWVEPAPIKKNTPVGPAQFNATGSAPGVSNNVPGTYKYDIPEGQTFAPGKYPVKVIFTPTDPNFLPSETTVTLTVIADINPLATPIVTPSNTPAGKAITNTTAAANAKVTTVGRGLTTATTDGTQVNIVPITSFSGKTSVTVSVTDEGETKEVEVPVTVLPLPVSTPSVTPLSLNTSKISWKLSINAESYEVSVGGKIACTTSATSCTVKSLVGPKTEVEVVAKGNDDTENADSTPVKYISPKKPVTALVVFFDTNKFNLDAKDKADIRAAAKIIIEQGFKNIVVNGHTDLRGGVDNRVLSRNRSNSTFDYLKSLVPGLNVTIGAFASTKPAVKGTSAAALASNRRAEVGVY
jgi:uncharacterized repeat protein (TIGR02543 family)